MNIPLDNEMYKKLIEMLENEKKECQKKADEQLRDAREKGNEFNAKFADEGIVKQYKEDMKFLITHDLLDDIKKNFDEFEQYVEEISEQTELAKIYGHASNVVKLTYEYRDQMVQRQLDKNWIQLVELLIRIHDNTIEL